MFLLFALRHCDVLYSLLFYLAAEHHFKVHWTLKGILLGKILEGKNTSLLLAGQFLSPAQCFHTSHVPGLLLKKCSWNWTRSFPQSGNSYKRIYLHCQQKSMVYSAFWEPNSWTLYRILLNRIHSLQLSAVRNLCKLQWMIPRCFGQGVHSAAMSHSLSAHPSLKSFQEEIMWRAHSGFSRIWIRPSG